MDNCHFKNSELEPKLQKYKGRVVLRGDIVKKWFGLFCSIHRARFICVTNDGCKSNWCHSRTTRMRRTSSWCSISLHPGQNGRCTIVIENSNARTSRYLDTSTKTQIAKINFQHGRRVVPLERNMYGHPLAGLLWERHFEKVLLEHGWEKVQSGNAYLGTEKKDYPFLCLWTTYIWLERNKTLTMWKVLMKEVDLDEPTSFLDHVYFGCSRRECETSKDIVDSYWNMFESRISAGAKESYLVQGNLTQTYLSGPVIWKVMQMKCVERYCELANRTTQQLYNIATPCLDDHQFKEEELGSVGELSKVCSQIILRCLYLARIGRPDILWSVNKLARAVTKWTRAWDKRLARLISCIHHTREFKQYCHVGNTAQQSRLGLFQDSDFARDLEDSKSTSGEILCILGSHTFVPISSMCKKNKHLFHTVRRNLRLSLLMQVYAWWDSRSWSLGFGYWSVAFFFQPSSEIRR